MHQLLKAHLEAFSEENSLRSKPVLSISVETGPERNWGPVDGRGHAMFGWRMEEKSFSIKS